MTAPETPKFQRRDDIVIKLKKDFTAVLKENGIGDMFEVRDRILAEYLVRVLMELAKMIDHTQENSST